jgi:hypothetical protein
MILDFMVALPGDGGELLVDGRGPVLLSPSKARFALPPRRTRGLQAIDVEWRGEAPLTVSAIGIAVVP